MIKLYFLGVIGLFSAAWFGLDWYMNFKKLSWVSIGEVWPLWVLLMIVGFLVGAAVWGVIAQAAMSKESRALNKRADEKNETYRQQLSDKQTQLIEQEKTLHKRVKLAEQELDEKEQRKKEKIKALKQKTEREIKQLNQEAEKRIEEAHNIKADAERLIIETKAENEIHQRSAFRATSTVKRLRRKIEKLQQQTGERSGLS